jgi:hypothetical protein
MGWDVADALFEAERLLRESAHEFSLGGSGSAKARRALQVLGGLIQEHCSAASLEQLCSALSALHYAARNALFGAEAALPEERRKRLRLADDFLNDAERLVKKLTGRPCRWGAGLEEEVRRRPAILINDLAACVHRLAEWAARLRPAVEGRCFVLEGSDPRAVDACVEWARAARLFEERGMYSSDDAEALSGYVSGSRVQLRVGSVSGHAAEIDVERGILRYYDTDLLVNQAVKRLLEELAGAECSLNKRAGGAAPSLECRVGDARAAARVLAAATSMDIRLGKRADAARREVEKGCILRGLRELLGPR